MWSTSALNIYGVVAGGILVALCMARATSLMARWANLTDSLITRHLTLPYIVRRHQLFGPWSRGSVLLHLSYIIVNIFLIFFGDSSLTGAGRRAGALALTNLTFLLSAMHLSFLADCLGITLRNCKRIHRAVGWMVIALQIFHIMMATLVSRMDFPAYEPENFAAILVRFLTRCSRSVADLS